MNLAQIRTALTAPELSQMWAESCEQIEGVSKDAQERCVQEISERRDEFLKVAEEVDDDEELEVTAALKYIELKSHWIMLNTLLNYQVFRKGESNPEQMLRASLASRLMLTVEALIGGQDLSKITKFLAEPIAK